MQTLFGNVLTVYSVNRGKATAAKSQIKHTLFSEDTPFSNRTQAYSGNGTSSAPIRSRTRPKIFLLLQGSL